MTGAELHTVLRALGHWSDEGEWVAGPETVFTVLGCLWQSAASALAMDPNGAETQPAAWTLLPEPGEPDLMVATDGYHGDRVRHGDGLLTVVARQELAPVGGLPAWRYDLIDRGQDPGVQP